MVEVADKFLNIYEYILKEESAYRTTRVPLADNWTDWNMRSHIDRSFTLKNSRFYQGPQDYTRPFDNIILPIANVNYRTEGFDVKDAQIYVDNAENYHKSFVARKFHDWWAKENKIDTAIDESVESYFDYGLTLMKNVGEAKPEVVDLKTLAFCDQTDILSGPICIKHHYSIAELQEMKGKWNLDAIDTAILMSRFAKEDNQDTSTPGKYAVVYELHGVFPESWLGKEKLGADWEDTGKYSPQIHIVTFYVSPTENNKVGATLFKGKEPKPIFKALKRDPIQGRACGRGGIEELFHPQIWTNYSQLHIHQMLEAVSKVLLVTTDKKLKNQKMSNLKHGQVIDIAENTRLEQLVIQPINKAAFDNAVDRWAMVAQKIGSATDAALSQTPASGVPLGTVEILAAQGQGIHEYRKGKIADFWAEIYRDWVLPHFATEINKGSRWLDELSLEELQDVASKVSTKAVNDRIKKAVLEGEMIGKDEVESLKQMFEDEFMKAGEKRFIEILKDEFADLPMDVEISIAGRQENLADTVTKLNAVFRAVFTPAGIQILKTEPEAGEMLNEILEKAGLTPRNFGTLSPIQPQQLTAPQGPQPAPELPVTT